jgi:hypothetical protein
MEGQLRLIVEYRVANPTSAKLWRRPLFLQTISERMFYGVQNNACGECGTCACCSLGKASVGECTVWIALGLSSALEPQMACTWYIDRHPDSMSAANSPLTRRISGGWGLHMAQQGMERGDVIYTAAIGT